MFGTADLPNGVRLRMARRSDEAVEREIHDANRPELLLLDGGQELVRSVLDSQRRTRDAEYARACGNALHYMIEKAGDTVGRLLLDFGQAEIRILDLALLPAARGQGIGTTVLRAMLNVAAQVGVPVVLSVRLDNLRAIRLYLALGFLPEAPTAEGPFARMRWLPRQPELERASA